MSTRVEAANLLRAIRAVGVQRAGDLLDWAMTVMPDSVCVQRLQIQFLLNRGDVIDANAAIARALLQRPRNTSLCQLRAECLIAQQHWTEADQEMRRVLKSRPHHRKAYELAVRAAIACGQPERAVALIDGFGAMPDDRMRALLIEALLTSDDQSTIERAQWTLDAMQNPPALLVAAVLEAQGCLLDAADALEETLHHHRCDEDEVMCRLLGVYERTGDTTPLRRMMDKVDESHPKSRVMVGLLLLGQGRFREAAVDAAKMSRHRALQSESLPTLVVAAALLGRTRLARLALGRMRRTGKRIDARVMAQRWQRGLLGHWLQSQQDVRQSGCDPGSSVLQMLLEEARRGTGTAQKSRRIKDSAGGIALLSERESVLVSSPVDN